MNHSLQPHKLKGQEPGAPSEGQGLMVKARERTQLTKSLSLK